MKNSFKRLIVLSLLLIIVFSGNVFAKDTRKLSDTLGLFRNVYIQSNEEVYGSTVAVFGNIQVDGQVNGDVVAIFGSTTVDGTVKGSVISIFGGVTVNTKGIIQEDVIQVLGGRINEEPGSQIWGYRMGISGFGIGGLTGVPLLIAIILGFTTIKLLIAYIMSVLAVLIFPQRFNTMSKWASVDISRRFLVGILVVVGYYVVSALLLLVVLGVPFVLLIIPIMALLSFTGNTSVKLAIGEKIGKSLGKNFSQMISLFIGTLVYAIVDLTIIGKSIVFVARAIGIGVVIDSNIGSKNPFIPTKEGISLDKNEGE